MPTPTIAVTCAASDQGGESVAGGIYTAKLDQTEIYDGFVVPEQVTATADADGLVILNLWPNALGVNGSSYRITARNPDTGKKFFDASVVVPNNPCNLYQIIQNAPFPNVDSAQQALIDVQALVAIVNQDVLATDDDRVAAEVAAAYALTRSADAALSQYNASLSEIAVEADRVAVAANTASAAATKVQIDHKYRGALAADPATRTDGTANQAGDEYFSTAFHLLKRWNGAMWQASDINTANLAAAGGAGLLGANAYQTQNDVNLEQVSVKRFGGVGNGVADETAAVLAMIAVHGYAYLPEGVWYIASPVVDTALLRGPGVLIAEQASGRQMLPPFRKNYADGGKVRVTLEDEYSSHLTTPQGDLYYTGLGTACYSNGSEVYAARIGRTHESDFAYPSAVVLYFFSKEKTPAVTKSVIYTTTVNEDVRDVNITAHPSRNNIVLIRFAEKLAAGGYQTRLITYNTGTRVIEANRLIAGPGGNDFSWGNSLLTPQGYLLFCTYRASGGGLDVWRTTAALPLAGAVTATLVSSLEVGNAVSEPCIGYWNARLVLVYRREGAAGRLVYSFDLEAPAAWSASVFPTGGVIHAPALIPYNTESVFTFACSTGSDRSKLSFCSTANFIDFKAFSQIAPAGAGNATGGYPSLLDMGGDYAVATYSDSYAVTQPTRRSRFERMEVPKNQVDLRPGELAHGRMINLPNAPVSGAAGLMTGNIYANNARTSSDGRNYSTELIVYKALTINALFFLLHGTANITAEIYEDGILIATSSGVAIATTAAVAVALPLVPSVTLVLYKRYSIKLLGSAAFSIYDLRHNTRRGRTIIQCDALCIDETRNGAGTSIASTSLIIPALGVAP